MKLVRLALLLSCAVPLLAAAVPSTTPTLASTELFSKIALSCRDVDVQNWKHPTAQTLRDAGTKVEAVQLCNDGRYPVYTVSFKYDPRTATDSYFHSLYAHMAAANGFWPFSFVDTADNVIVNVGIDKKHELHIDYEGYAPKGGE
jgi:hypothetical protein